MPTLTLTLTDDQVIELAEKLPDRKKQQLLKLLLMQPWESWAKLTHDGPDKARLPAKKTDTKTLSAPLKKGLTLAPPLSKGGLGGVKIPSNQQ